jgi:hypothetical protein
MMKTLLLSATLLVGTASAANTLSDEGYGVVVFECDSNLKQLPTVDRQKKIPATSYRLCFAPNQKALTDGVGIEKIDYFNWELTHRNGVAEQQAVIKGDGDNILSILTCEEDGKLCYLASMLGSPFYVDSGSVLGYGAATLTGNKGKVEMERFLFPKDFKFKMVNPDGTEMAEDEVNDLMGRMAEQEKTQEAAAAETEAEL